MFQNILFVFSDKENEMGIFPLTKIITEHLKNKLSRDPHV